MNQWLGSRLLFFLAKGRERHETSMAETRWIVSACAFVALVTRDDQRVTFCVAGAIVNALVNKGLKRLIAQARPPGSPLHDPGMPSSHASSLFFFTAYIALALMQHAAPYGGACAIALIALAGCAARSRVPRFHTTAQVSVGAVVGSLAGAAWHELARPQLEPRFAAKGSALAVAGVLGVGMLSVWGQESHDMRRLEQLAASSRRRQ